MQAVIFALQTIVALIVLALCAAAVAFVAQFLSILDEVPFLILFLVTVMVLVLSMAPHFLKDWEDDCITCKIGKKISRI